MVQEKCPSCGAAVIAGATECKYCGGKIAVQEAPPPYQQQQQPYSQPQPQGMGGHQMGTQQAQVVRMGRNKITAGLLGIFLGGLGAHKFYLGQTGMGILYLIFCWTFIPSIVGFIEGITYLCMSDATFASRYDMKILA